MDICNLTQTGILSSFTSKPLLHELEEIYRQRQSLREEESPPRAEPTPLANDIDMKRLSNVHYSLYKHYKTYLILYSSKRAAEVGQIVTNVPSQILKKCLISSHLQSDCMSHTIQPQTSITSPTTPSDNIQLLTGNITGCNKMSDGDLLEFLSKFNIIAFQETWLTTGNEDIQGGCNWLSG